MQPVQPYVAAPGEDTDTILLTARGSQTGRYPPGLGTKAKKRQELSWAEYLGLVRCKHEGMSIPGRGTACADVWRQRSGCVPGEERAATATVD